VNHNRNNAVSAANVAHEQDFNQHQGLLSSVRANAKVLQNCSMRFNLSDKEHAGAIITTCYILPGYYSGFWASEISSLWHMAEKPYCKRTQLV
jgi:hypothetical protein